MKMIFLAIVLAGCSSSSFETDAILIPTSETKGLMSQSVLLIVEERAISRPIKGIIPGCCTATVASWNGRTGIFVAWHSVPNNKTLILIGNGITESVGPFVQLGPKDIGWCAMVLPREWVPFKVAAYKADYGSVIAFGYPMSQDKLKATIGTDAGIIKNYRKIKGHAEPGMSGGPVVISASFELIGIVSHRSPGMYFAAIIR